MKKLENLCPYSKFCISLGDNEECVRDYESCDEYMRITEYEKIALHNKKDIKNEKDII